MQLRKVKRPAGIFSFEIVSLDEDEHGFWFHAAAGSLWTAPHGTGKLPYDVVLLLHPERWWAAWWVDDPADQRIEIDVCLPPEQSAHSWSYIDLELDPVLHLATETVKIQDWDEFEEACRGGWITKADAAGAKGIAEQMALALRQRASPFGEEGWRNLREARRHLSGVGPGEAAVGAQNDKKLPRFQGGS